MLRTLTLTVLILTASASASTAYLEGDEITVVKTAADKWTMVVFTYESGCTGQTHRTYTNSTKEMIVALCALQPDFGDSNYVASAFLFICSDFGLMDELLDWVIQAGA